MHYSFSAHGLTQQSQPLYPSSHHHPFLLGHVQRNFLANPGLILTALLAYQYTPLYLWLGVIENVRYSRVSFEFPFWEMNVVEFMDLNRDLQEDHSLPTIDLFDPRSSIYNINDSLYCNKTYVKSCWFFCMQSDFFRRSVSWSEFFHINCRTALLQFIDIRVRSV